MLKLKCNIYANRSVKFSDKIGSLLQHKNSLRLVFHKGGWDFLKRGCAGLGLGRPCPQAGIWGQPDTLEP